MSDEGGLLLLLLLLLLHRSVQGMGVGFLIFPSVSALLDVDMCFLCANEMCFVCVVV